MVTTVAASTKFYSTASCSTRQDTYSTHTPLCQIHQPLYPTYPQSTSAPSTATQISWCARTRTMIRVRMPLLLILVIGAFTLPGQWRCQSLKWPSLRPFPAYPSSRPSFDRLDAVQTAVAPPLRRSIVESQEERQQDQELEGTEFRLPPDDGTFSFSQTIKEIWYGPGVNKDREARYATMMRTSTGVWRSRLLGLFPYAVRSALRRLCVQCSFLCFTRRYRG